MTKTKLSLLMLSLSIPGYSVADELGEMQKNPDTWVMSAGDYANTRYSQLSEINLDNVQDLKMAWSFSTGVLRGHEGNSLIIDDVISAGTSVGESVAMIRAAGAEPAGVVIALDRQERGKTDISAIAQVEADYGIPVISIICLADLLQYLDGQADLQPHRDAVAAYRAEYGV